MIWRPENALLEKVETQRSAVVKRPKYDMVMADKGWMRQFSRMLLYKEDHLQ